VVASSVTRVVTSMGKMSEGMDLEVRWPHLFEGLTRQQCFAVVQACAANWHEGWTPNEFDVRNLTNVMRGTISQTEYLDRALAKAKGRVRDSYLPISDSYATLSVAF